MSLCSVLLSVLGKITCAATSPGRMTVLRPNVSRTEGVSEMSEFYGHDSAFAWARDSE